MVITVGNISFGFFKIICSLILLCLLDVCFKVINGLILYTLPLSCTTSTHLNLHVVDCFAFFRSLCSLFSAPFGKLVGDVV